jgi:hypothetical protein
MPVKSIAAALAVGLAASSSTSAAVSVVNSPGSATPVASNLVAMPAHSAGGNNLTASPSSPANLGAFNIVIAPGTGLAGNAPALAAFNRAAQQWANFISDPITVTIDADLTSSGFPSSNIIGSTSAVALAGGYNLVRDALVADGADEADDGIVASMPTAAQFTGFLPAGRTFSGNIVINKANAKALGFTGLDAPPAMGGFGASDGEITFNSAFAFDFDNSDGVGPGLTDFETVAAHEIGHLLGFVSSVDDIDQTTAAQYPAVDVAVLDLFRFRDNTASDPGTAADFTTFARDLVPGQNDTFDDTANEWRMSTGVSLGDGRQASHWKDDSLTGSLIGIMDPTLSSGVIETVLSSDLRAMDLIGYEIAVPEPSSFALLAGGGLLVLRRRRRA